MPAMDNVLLQDRLAFENVHWSENRLKLNGSISFSTKKYPLKMASRVKATRPGNLVRLASMQTPVRLLSSKIISSTKKSSKKNSLTQYVSALFEMVISEIGGLNFWAVKPQFSQN